MAYYLSTNFTLEELTHSDYAVRYGIDNTLPLSLTQNMTLTARKLEMIREELKVPIIVTSGYRCMQLNTQIGGSGLSAHMSALACDFVTKDISPYDVCVRLAPLVFVLGIDQLIYEGRWTHVGYVKEGEKPRGQVLTALFKNSGTQYLQGVVRLV